MKCKPGDLAVIIGGNPEAIGGWVNVEKLCLDDPGCWVVAVLQKTPGFIDLGLFGMVPVWVDPGGHFIIADHYLQPVRGTKPPVETDTKAPSHATSQ